MNRKMSPRGQRRGQSNSELKYAETTVDGSTDFNVGDESDPNIKYTSTPLKTGGANRLQHRSSAPNFDSEESTDPVARAQARPSKRRKKERVPSAADHGGRRRRRSKRRRNNDNLKEGGENDEMARPGTEKEGHRPGEEETGELPIADLLRKAQENQKSLQTRYEDPTPLPELTTDTVYVQGRNGFSAVKIGNFRNERSCGDISLRPIHVAIRIHDFSKTLMFFCQGLLGGIALSQVVLAPKISQNSADYPAHVMSGIFLFLVTVSLVAAMDRIDLAHLDLENLREIFSHRCITIVTFPLYLAAICIHLVSMNSDENATGLSQEAEGRNSDAPVVDEEYASHRQIHTWKFVLCIIAWLCISLGPNDDLTTINLEAMQKYAN